MKFVNTDKVFICIAKCPEIKGSPRCGFICQTDDDYRELKNHECPCGNTPQWIRFKDLLKEDN